MLRLITFILLCLIFLPILVDATGISPSYYKIEFKPNLKKEFRFIGMGDGYKINFSILNSELSKYATLYHTAGSDICFVRLELPAILKPGKYIIRVQAKPIIDPSTGIGAIASVRAPIVIYVKDIPSVSINDVSPLTIKGNENMSFLVNISNTGNIDFFNAYLKIEIKNENTLLWNKSLDIKLLFNTTKIVRFNNFSSKKLKFGNYSIIVSFIHKKFSIEKDYRLIINKTPGIKIETKLGKSSYKANEQVMVPIIITNEGNTPLKGKLAIGFISNLYRCKYEREEDIYLDFNEVKNFSFYFNTGRLYPGGYKICTKFKENSLNFTYERTNDLEIAPTLNFSLIVNLSNSSLKPFNILNISGKIIKFGNINTTGNLTITLDDIKIFSGIIETDKKFNYVWSAKYKEAGEYNLTIRFKYNDENNETKIIEIKKVLEILPEKRINVTINLTTELAPLEIQHISINISNQGNIVFNDSFESKISDMWLNITKVELLPGDYKIINFSILISPPFAWPPGEYTFKIKSKNISFNKNFIILPKQILNVSFVLESIYYNESFTPIVELRNDGNVIVNNLTVRMKVVNKNKTIKNFSIKFLNLNLSFNKTNLSLPAFNLTGKEPDKYKIVLDFYCNSNNCSLYEKDFQLLAPWIKIINISYNKEILAFNKFNISVIIKNLGTLKGYFSSSFKIKKQNTSIYTIVKNFSLDSKEILNYNISLPENLIWEPQIYLLYDEINDSIHKYRYNYINESFKVLPKWVINLSTSTTNLSDGFMLLTNNPTDEIIEITDYPKNPLNYSIKNSIKFFWIKINPAIRNISFRFHYSNANLINRGIDEKSLAIYFWNNSWTKLISHINLNKNYIEGLLLNSGLYTISGNKISYNNIKTGGSTKAFLTKKCVEYWVCSEWSRCLNGIKTRKCIDKNNCSTIENKPLVKMGCKIKENFESNGNHTSKDNVSTKIIVRIKQENSSSNNQNINNSFIFITGNVINSVDEHNSNLFFILPFIIFFIILKILKN